VKVSGDNFNEVLQVREAINRRIGLTLLQGVSLGGTKGDKISFRKDESGEILGPLRKGLRRLNAAMGQIEDLVLKLQSFDFNQRREDVVAILGEARKLQTELKRIFVNLRTECSYPVLLSKESRE